MRIFNLVFTLISIFIVSFIFGFTSRSLTQITLHLILECLEKQVERLIRITHFIE